MPSAVTVLNPGVAVPPAFADLADVIVTFEGSCEDYLTEGTDGGFEPLSWQPGPDQTIWHMIHHTPDPARAAEVMALSRTRGADLVYVTDECGENPYSSLPSSDIWTPSIDDQGHRWRLHSLLGRRAPPTEACGTASNALEANRLPRSQAQQRLDRPSDVDPPSARGRGERRLPRRFLLAEGLPRYAAVATSPRWWTGSDPQIAADWMIENNRLYSYAGTGTDWVWTPAGEATFEASGTRVCWQIEADEIGLDPHLDDDIDVQAAFHVSAPGLREYSSVADGFMMPTERAAR